MNYSEIRQNLISLGFAETTDLEEFDELGYTYDAINRAIREIGNTFPYISTYEFELDSTDEGMLYINMEDQEGFLDFAETPILFEKDNEEFFKKFSDYQIEMGHTIVIDADDYEGSFRIYYNRQCSQVTENTEGTFVPEIPLKAHYLIPLLAAYYLWLDDDERKATQYYNMYETELALLMQKENEPRARVVTDRDWGFLQ